VGFTFKKLRVIGVQVPAGRLIKIIFPLGTYLFRMANRIEFKRRKENFHQIESSIGLLENEIKKRIKAISLLKATDNILSLTNELDNFTFLLAGLNGVWTEALVKWIIQEHDAFTSNQIAAITKVTSLKSKWEFTFKSAVTNKYSITTSNQSGIASKQQITNFSSMTDAEKDRIDKMFTLINNKLLDTVDIRNKVQHGEWKNAYEKDVSSGIYIFSQSMSDKLRYSNILSLKIKRKQIFQLYLMLKDYCTFKHYGKFNKDIGSNPFDYFFPKRYNQILALQREIDTSSFTDYVNHISEKHRRAAYWQRKNRIKHFIRYLKFWNK